MQQHPPLPLHIMVPLCTATLPAVPDQAEVHRRAQRAVPRGHRGGAAGHVQRAHTLAGWCGARRHTGVFRQRLACTVQYFLISPCTRDQYSRLWGGGGVRELDWAAA